MMSLWYKVQRDKVAKRQKALQDMENGIKIYTEVGRGFMLKAVKNILISVRFYLLNLYIVSE